MSRSLANESNSKIESARAARASAAATPAPHVPLKPRKTLLIVMVIATLLWIAALITMYFTTVYHTNTAKIPSNVPRALQER